MYSVKLEKMFALGIATLLALGLDSAYADCTSSPPSSGWSCSDNNNFTMLTSLGSATGGTNDVTFAWDGTYRTSVVTDGTYNATLSSPEPFFGYNWTAKNVNIYGPGTYIFDTCPGDGSNLGSNPCPAPGTNDQYYVLTVPTGYVGAHMLFDWSVNSNIDVVQLWKMNDSWAGTTVSTDPTKDKFQIGDPNVNGNTASTVWSFVSIDTPESTIGYPVTKTSPEPTEINLHHGTKMIDGPFVQFSANFNVMLDKNPSAFYFTDQTNVVLNTQTESNATTVTGTNGSRTEIYLISVTNGEYSINGGTYTSTMGTVIEGQTVKVRHTSSSSSCGVVDTTLNIGGTTDTFSTTATGSGCTDTTPNAFTFTDQIGVAVGATIESNTITVQGIDGSPVTVSISITDGEYSVNSGAYTSAAGTVALNDTVKVRHTSSTAYETSTDTTLTIGGVSDTFTSTTAASTTVSVQAPENINMPTGGCSISTQTADAGNRADWWLVAGFIVWLGMIVRRRRQNQA